MRIVLSVMAIVLSVVTPALADNILVLPFFNSSTDSNLDWIGESVSETVRDALATDGIIMINREDREEAYRRLSVRPRTQLTKATVIRIAEFLDSEQVVYGWFAFTPAPAGEPKTRGSIRITAQIINLRKASRGPDFTEIGPLQDLARLQTHLAWQVFQFLRPESAPSEEDFRARRPEIKVGAIEYYTRALLFTDADQQLKLLQSAVGVDPAFSPAHFHIGRIQFDKKNYRIASEHLSKVAPYDHRYRRAHFLLGLSRFFTNDFKGAQQAFHGVAESVPLNEVWNNLGAAQSRLNLPQALSSFQKALEGDPADPDYHFNVGYSLFKLGKLDEAAERFRAVLDRDPDDAEAILMLGRCLQPPNSRSSGNLRTEGLERLKTTFEESAYLQLKAVLQPKK